jgi:hypothetical protein
MLSRACIFAAVTFLASCLAGPAAWAQVQNLEAGKSASQLFAGTCNACHKSPRGLLKTVSPGSLPGFLREHYTTSGDMASQLSSYLVSNGASDPRQAKQGADKQGPGGNDQADRQGRKNRNVPAQEAARPDDGAIEGARPSRRRQARPGEPSEDVRAPAQAAVERIPDGRRLKRSGRPGQPGIEEPSVANEPAKLEPPKADSAKAEPTPDDRAKAETPRSGTPKGETGVAERAKPDTDAKSNEAKIEAPKDAGASDKPAVRRDPVPANAPASPSAAAVPATAPAVASSEPAAPQPKAPAASEPPAVTASAPPPPPASRPPQAGPPMPPISQ